MVCKMATACQFAIVDPFGQSFFSQFFPSFIYETFFISSPKFKYGFCTLNDSQNGRQLVVCTELWTLTESFSTFHIWITFINSFPRSTVGFVRWTITKMAAKMATACQFVFVDTLTWLFYYPISSKFSIWFTFIKLLPMFKYGCCLVNNNQDGPRIGYPLFTAGHYVGSFV